LDFQIKDSLEAKLPTKNENVSLVGCCLLEGAILALWRGNQGLAGWTWEDRASKIPNQRKLKPEDCLDWHIFSKEFWGLEWALLKVIKAEIAL